MSQQQQELLDEEPTSRSWQPLSVQQQQQAASCGSLTAIGLATPSRHQHSGSQKSGRLGQDFGASGSPSIGATAAAAGECWTPMNDAASVGSSSSGWRHLTSSPSRRAQQQQQQQQQHQQDGLSSLAGGSRRLSPHCWSSESLLKDHSGGSRWSESHSSHAIESDREPFIPPPPLLDFETANLLPPLGIDVSSPSDDLHFLPVSSGHHHHQQQQHHQHHQNLPLDNGDQDAAGSSGVNWVQIPPQYATLRRPGRSGSGSVDNYPTSGVRRPRSSSNNSNAQASSSSASSSVVSASWLDAADHDSSVSSGGCHRTVGADGMSRKCTCGQKMRPQQQQQQSQQQQQQQHQQMLHQQGNNASSLYAAAGMVTDMPPGSGHIRSEDGLAGIATLRRPVKRKGRSQLPGVQQQVSASPQPTNSVGVGSGMGSQTTTAAAAAAAAILQQPKLETSVLLDKLLRAGALRPEDYLVLSRMERMIMANHAAGGAMAAGIGGGGGAGLSQPVGSSVGARVRPPKSGSDRQSSQQSIISPSDSSSDIRRSDLSDFSSVGSKHLIGGSASGMPVAGQQLASSENLYESPSPAPSSSSAVAQHQQHYQRRMSAGNNGSDMPLRMQPIQLSSARPSPGPSPFDYYNSGMAYGTTTGRGSSMGAPGSAEANTTTVALMQQQQSSSQQICRMGATSTDSMFGAAQGGPYQPLPSLQSSRCCPCCGSPSHPQLQQSQQQQQQQHHHHHHHHHHHTCSLCGGGPHLAAGSTTGTASVASTSSNYSAYNSGNKMMIQPQPTTGNMASSAYGYTPTGRHFSAGGVDQYSVAPGGPNSGPVSKYPSLGSSTASISGSSQAQQQQQQQSSMVLGKVSTHPQQPGIRTEMHSLPSNEPIRYQKKLIEK